MSIANARPEEELDLRDKIRAEYFRQIISVQEEERRRIARELHDVTSQIFASLKVSIELLSSNNMGSLKDTTSQLSQMKALLLSGSREVHRLIYDLRPPLLDDLGLIAAMRSCVHNALDSAGVKVSMKILGHEIPLPRQVDITIFRIVQEAITNIASHAQAKSAYICVQFWTDSVTLQIQDDGVGFDSIRLLNPVTIDSGVGLLGMKERAELIGATFAIETEPGHGTRIILEVPIKGGKDIQNKGSSSR